MAHGCRWQHFAGVTNGPTVRHEGVQRQRHGTVACRLCRALRHARRRETLRRRPQGPTSQLITLSTDRVPQRVRQRARHPTRHGWEQHGELCRERRGDACPARGGRCGDAVELGSKIVQYWEQFRGRVRRRWTENLPSTPRQTKQEFAISPISARVLTRGASCGACGRPVSRKATEIELGKTEKIGAGTFILPKRSTSAGSAPSDMASSAVG
jgi:hypothetical protein